MGPKLNLPQRSPDNAAAGPADRGDLLLLARPLDGQKHLRRHAHRPGPAVCGRIAARYATARVPVRAETPGVRGWRRRPTALARLLVNLLDNAVRHAASRVCRGRCGRTAGGRYWPL